MGARREQQVERLETLQCKRVWLHDCFDDALQFRNQNRQEARDASYFEWRYQCRPCAVPAYVVWVSDGGQFLGAATVAPHDFRICGRDIKLGVVGDISVSKDARGKGVGSRLLAYIREELPSGVDDVFVLPNAEVEGPLRRAGWKSLGLLERRVRLLDQGEVSFSPRSLARTALSILSALPEKVLINNGSEYSILQATDSSLVAIDRVWADAQVDICLSRRDAAYIRWRYRDHPHIEYDIEELVCGGNACGYLVSHSVGNSRWIDDFLVSDRSRAVTLCLEVVRAAEQEGACVDLQVRQLRNTSGLPWSRVGFIRRSDTQAALSGGRPISKSGVPAPWYLTAGDKDV